MKLRLEIRSSEKGYTLYIVAFLLFVIVGGWIVWHIITLFQHQFPPAAGGEGSTNETWRSTTTMRNVLGSNFAPMAMTPAEGFPVQYGFDTGFGPWVDLNHTPPADYVEIESWGHDETDFHLVAVIYGTVWLFNPEGTFLTDDAAGEKSLVLERSTNMLDWIGVWTNAVIQNEINTWLDVDGSPEAFYRTRLL